MPPPCWGGALMFIVLPLAVCFSYFMRLNSGKSRFLALRPAPDSLSGHEVRWPPAQAGRKSQLKNWALHSSRANSLCEMKTRLPEGEHRGALPGPWTCRPITADRPWNMTDWKVERKVWSSNGHWALTVAFSQTGQDDLISVPHLQNMKNYY